MYTKALITLALASLVATTPISKRQTRTTSKEFSQGGCRDVLFAWARGSTEAGNMGTIVGPPTSDAIKAQFGAQNVATEGIDYAAALAPNALPGGTDAQSAQLMQDTITAMASQCPDSTIVVGGYSQGAAVVHRAVESLPAATMDRIAGVVTYGDTQKQQDNNQIPGFDAAKTKIICAQGDLVCVGTLTILPPHLSYGANAQEGADFLNQMIVQAQGAATARKVKREWEMVERAAASLGGKVRKMGVEMVA
ncbi:carbohydrate esterase family 5 protein [Lentithecium fluviatile CBS 122367]|uniref:Cutinase n=1 Tax=Lentithecium fluviatile CBS 122367 TaxID=1168545 RepID=A0A6G1IKA8_9PLEO|nr:carbohydrate esterase family 5 protein [Lentithecium fluviatile CBS 122367]